jgi:hypothetical protein
VDGERGGDVKALVRQLLVKKIGGFSSPIFQQIQRIFQKRRY